MSSGCHEVTHNVDKLKEASYWKKTSKMKLILERRIQISGVLILIGLLIELISFHWSHPTAFLLFATVGGLFLVVGILFYLFSLVTQRGEQ